MLLLFLAGLATGLHCISMCGNLVVGYALSSNQKGRNRFLPHIIYNASRLLSYVFTGVILGLVGKALNLNKYAPVATIAGAIFLLFLAMKISGISKHARLGSFSTFNRWISAKIQSVLKKARKESETSENSYKNEVLLGLLSGFMPCTPLQAAQIYAAGTGSPLEGGLAMLVFGAGTIPFMFSFGILAQKISLKARNLIPKLSAVILVIMALVLLNRGLILMNSPVTASTIVSSFKSTLKPASAETPKSDGPVTVKIRIENVTYQPSQIQVPENTPVILEVFRNEESVCSNELVIPALGIRSYLTPYAVTRIELPPMKKGVYQMTCQMGMMDGVIIVGSGNSSQAQIFLILFGLISISAAGFLYMKYKPAKVSSNRSGGKKR